MLTYATTTNFLTLTFSYCLDLLFISHGAEIMIKPAKLRAICTNVCFIFTLLIATILPSQVIAAPLDACPNNDRVFCERFVPQQVTTRALNNAIGRAKLHFQNQTNKIYIIILPKGRYNIRPDPQQPVSVGQGLIRTNKFPALVGKICISQKIS